MGLFGGFKAKFNSRVKNKPNNSKKESTVVCLSYRSFSEFEIPINVHRRSDSPIRNEPVAEKQPELTPLSFDKLPEARSEETSNGVKSILKTKSAYESDNDDTHNKNVFENKVSKSSVNNKRANDEDQVLYTFQTEIEEEISTDPMTEAKEKEKDTRRNTILDVSYFTHQQDYSSEEEEEVEDDNKSIQEDVQLDVQIDIHENSTDIIYVNPEDTTDVYYGNAEGEAVQHNENFYFETPEDDYTDNSYQVHHRVQYDTNSMDSYHNSEDNLSENASLDFNAMGYSSQAASIFFGGDENIPPKPRPRTFTTYQEPSQEPDSQRSSMSA